jgi:type IV pilus assembly protein PilQ
MVSQNKHEVHKRKRLIGGCVWLAAMAVCATFVIAQDAEVMPAEPTAAEAPVIVVEPEVVPQEAAPVNGGSDQTVFSGQSIQTISFKKDMPIKDALRMLAQMYQKNIVPSAKVDGIVTVSYLYDVTFEEALQAILGTHKYEAKGNFIKVYTNEEFMADKSRLEHAIIELYFINAEEGMKLILPLLSEMGRAGATTPAERDTTAGKGGDSLAIRDMLSVSDYPENIRMIREALVVVDQQPSQVLIEVTILEANLTERTQFGIDFRSLNLDLDPLGVLNAGDSGLAQRGFASTGQDDTGLRIGIVNDRVDIIITALEGITDTTLLANTKILALNKQAGHVMIGRREGYVTTSQVSADGAIQQVEFLEGGTRLAFRPFVCDGGLIRMEINPKQSTPEVRLLGGFVVPREDTTEVITNVMVRDGKTIVLGGLFKERTSLNRSQVPLLGDLPLVGNLFRGTDDTSERVELIVLLTPHIIAEPEQADGAMREQDVERLAWNARHNLIWMSRARIDEARYAKAVKLYEEGRFDEAMSELNSPFAIDRNFLDPIRLRERIIREQQPDQVEQIERIMLRNLEKEESGKWMRK